LCTSSPAHRATMTSIGTSSKTAEPPEEPGQRRI
jgi:hypothetical protein